MAKVYGGVQGIEVPNPDYSKGIKHVEAEEEVYVQKIKDYAKLHGKGPNKGEEVSFPHADGFARYVVLEGSKLIHLKVGDAWHAPIANYITAKGIKEEIERSKGLAALFAEHRKRQGFDKPKQ